MEVNQTGAPVGERLVQISSNFKGIPYLRSALGEGSGKDADPMLRYDAVDCMTFVEQSLALTQSSSPETVRTVLDGIRYDGLPAWETRNHLVEAQWLPHLIASGILTEVTAEVGGTPLRKVSRRLTKATWRSNFGRSFALPKAVRPMGTFPLLVIPKERAVAALRGLTPGHVLVIAGRNNPLSAVMHMGISLRLPNGAVGIRHASSRKRQVVDESLRTFIAKAGPSLVGFAVFAPQDVRQ